MLVVLPHVPQKRMPSFRERHSFEKNTHRIQYSKSTSCAVRNCSTSCSWVKFNKPNRKHHRSCDLHLKNRSGWLLEGRLGWGRGRLMGSVWENCWVERMVRTGVQHVRGCGREPKCGMSVHRVSGALGARGSGGFGTVWGGCGDGWKGIWSVLQICAVVS